MNIAGKPHPLKPQTAVFIPPHTMHQINADDTADLDYLVLYAPPGPEQQLRLKQAHAFDENK